jgi:hypothetical protein
MKSFFPCCTFFLLLSFVTRAQNIEIGFDSSGRMVQFPPAVIRPGAKLTFTVTTSQQFLHAELTQITDRISKAIGYANTDSNRAGWPCLFEMTNKDYAGYLTQARDYLQSLGPCERPDPSKLNPKITAILPLADYIPAAYDSQFEVKVIGRNKKTTDSIFLTLGKDACKKNCLTFKGEISRKVRDILKNQCPSCWTDSLQFQLVYHNPFNSTLIKLFNSQEDTTMKIFDSTAFISTFMPIGKAFDPLDGIQCDTFTHLIKEFTPLGKWMMAWLWYSGKLTINPFPVLSEARQKQIKDSIDLLNKEMAKTTELEQFIDSSKVKLWPAERHYAAYGRLIDQGNMLKQTFSQDSTLLVKLKKAQKDSITYVDQIAATSNFLYNGKLVISRDGRVVVEKQFDAQDQYQVVYSSRRELERMTEIPENERLVLMIQNADTAANLNATERLLPFNDLEEFTQLVTSQLSAANINSATAAQYASFEGTIAQLFNSPSQGLANLAPAANPTILNWKGAPCPCSGSYGILRYAYDNLTARRVILPSAKLFKPQQLGKPQYATNIIRTLVYKHTTPTPFTDSVTLKQIVKKDTTVLTNTYLKVGQLRFMQLAAGIMFLHKPVSTTTIDTAAGALKANTSTTAATSFFGFKLYLLAKNYNRDNSLLPRYPLRRLSFFAGFDIIHPLNNFYYGGGYDIVPGLAVLVGDNIFLRTYNQVENNQIVNTTKGYQSGSLVYGVTVNPVLFVQYIKTFF